MLDKAVIMVLEEQTGGRRSTASMLQEAARRLGKKQYDKSSHEAAKELGGSFHAVAVQYNPATLEICAAAVPVDYGNPQTAQMQDAIKQNLELGTATLTFELVIDDNNHKDVQKTVQGLLGLLTDTSTKQVIFYWGRFSFYGEVHQVEASYDLFAHTGKPLRGKVQMSIHNSDYTGVA